MSIGLLVIWTNAAFWSAAPLLGWGSYTGRRDLNTQSLAPPPLTLTLRTAPALDRGYGTCEIDWAKATYSGVYRSYIVSTFICCFFIPVLVMLFCYVSIINTVKRGNALSAEGDLTDRQRKIERDVTIVSLWP